MEILLGLLIIAIGSFGQSSCYVPINKIKKWSWESYWIVQGVFAWLILPLLGALLAVPASTLPSSPNDLQFVCIPAAVFSGGLRSFSAVAAFSSRAAGIGNVGHFLIGVLWHVELALPGAVTGADCRQLPAGPAAGQVPFSWQQRDAPSARAARGIPQAARAAAS